MSEEPTTEIDPTARFNITFTVDEANIILMALDEMPYGRVRELVAKIHLTANEALGLTPTVVNKLSDGGGQ